MIPTSANMQRSPRFLFPLSLLALLLLLMTTSCVSTDQKAQRKEHLPLFFVEAIGSELKSSKIVSVQLPVSASVIQIKPVPSIPHFEIESVTIASGEMGKYLQFSLKNKFRLKLMQLCGEYRGRRLVLVLGQNPVGSWRINKILEDGILSTYVEIPEEDLPQLVDAINRAINLNH